MRCELKKQVDVQCVDVFAEVGVLVPRPELGHLCRTARDSGGTITDELVKQALPGISGAAARNIRDWCYKVGICGGSDARLNRQGHEAAETDRVPMPEQGVFGMWLAEHPLLGCRVLHLVRRFPNERDPRYQDLEPLVLLPPMNRRFTSLVDPELCFVIRDLPSGGEGPQCLRQGIGTCELRWTLDFSRDIRHWVLTGHLGNARGGGPIRHTAEEPDLDMIWLRNLLAEEHLSSNGQWNADSGRLAVSFEDVLEDELSSFISTFELGSVEIPDRGSYDDVTLVDVPIGPSKEKDAEAWAHALLEKAMEKASRYLARPDIRRMFTTIVEDTPLEPLDPRLRAHEAVAGGLVDRRDLWWAVRAPVDLCPFPLSQEELGAELASPRHRRGSSVREDSTIRIPHGARWSMAELVERLAGGGLPSRVLLCDRYVRGQNLGMLELWVKALRERAPDVVLEVFTDKVQPGEDNFEPICRITGRKARDYSGVFGRKRSRHPHDRYVLVDDLDGDGVAWQLSNSPLDAVADGGKAPKTDSPLHWRDLTGNRVPADELMPELAGWLLKGGAS